MKKSFFDTSIFIYALENKSITARNLFQKALTEGIVGTSTITIMEYASGCLKHGKMERLNNFRYFLKALMFEVVPVNDVIALKAAEIRSQYQFFKPIDALQLATAFVSGADVFFTNDKQLLQYQELFQYKGFYEHLQCNVARYKFLTREAFLGLLAIVTGN